MDQNQQDQRHDEMSQEGEDQTQTQPEPETEGFSDTPSTPQAQPEASTNQSQEPQALPAKAGKGFIVGGIIVIALLLGGIGYLGYELLSGSDETAGEVAGEATGPVALVNGEEISRERFNFRYSLEAKNAPAQGLDLSDQNTENLLRQRVLDNLVTVELLLQEADKQNVTVEDQQIDDQFQILADNNGGTEALLALLSTDGITEQELKNDIREQFKIEQFVENYSETLGIEVTDDEIEAAYENAKQFSDALPPLESVSEQIRQQLMRDKSVSAVNQLLESLKAESDIQLLLE